MDSVIMEKINKTIENLKSNNMQAYYCETSEDVCKKVEELINDGDIISNGGSVTLKQTGVEDLIKNGRYNYLDRSAPNLTREEVQDIYRKAFSCDVYFSSANAITENGQLYNVDGNSNRVSAILFGPKSVIIIAGYNKIVKNIDEAILRVKTCAAPPNTIRLNLDTYCSKTGKCVSLNKEDSELCDGCKSKTRICCNYVVSGYQRHKDRIKVIIVGEELGY